MNDRLRVMQLAMMGFGSAEPTEASVPRFNRGAPGPQATKAADVILALRKALAVERQARIAAEARLRAVLAEIARRPAAQPTPPPVFERPALPAAPAAETVVEVEGEIVDSDDVLGAMRDEIMMDGEEDEEIDNG